ncbi:hypothetical protein T265_11904 [Opisthorchis viverrini]|uniref:Uncharacterized protein n=1 Tax=Opisthorchis viverrini TaxID=6198 RepID=A0A074Z1A8_OPIVI|nr:hypothetical protein T265_11904 [Opisthorchis viverrini]KER19262.1 hypothetical protein T265_11904 [Opisthorchis viverrini]
MSDTVTEPTDVLVNGVFGVYHIHTGRLLTAPLSRDSDFRTRKHHTVPSSMEDLNIPMNDGFPTDYVRSVSWFRVEIRHFTQRNATRTLDFQHKCRDVIGLGRWNAFKLRQFLLHIEPAVLRDISHPDVYKCFCKDFYGGVQLSSQHYADFLIDVSKVCVAKFAAIFGPNHLFHNIHSFSYLLNFVKPYGYLDCCSCFLYESELGHLKYYIYGPKPLAVQLYRRLAEKGLLWG